jgi:hypothetical protein
MIDLPGDDLPRRLGLFWFVAKDRNWSRLAGCEPSPRCTQPGRVPDAAEPRARVRRAISSSTDRAVDYFPRGRLEYCDGRHIWLLSLDRKPNRGAFSAEVVLAWHPAPRNAAERVDPDFKSVACVRPPPIVRLKKGMDMDDVSRVPTTTMNNQAWRDELRKTRGLENCELPEHIAFGGNKDEFVLELSEPSLTANMQSDDAAFEAWAMALRVHCAVPRGRIQIKNGLSADRNKHVERFLYRLRRFDALFPVDTDGHGKSGKVFAENAKLFLNQPGRRQEITESEREQRLAGIAAISGAAPERDLELALEVSPSLRKAFARENPELMPVMRQWLVGVFRDKVKDDQYRIFTGGKSAIDLIGIDGKTLVLFELKNTKNVKAGALSETFFYASVMRDALLGKFAFEQTPRNRKQIITPQDILDCTDIRAVILAPRLHPLIYSEQNPGSPSIIDSLNQAADREWRDKPVHFEAWTFTVDHHGSPADFAFTQVAGR